MFQRGLPLVTDQVTFEKLVNGKMALRGNVGAILAILCDFLIVNLHLQFKIRV